MTKLNPTGSGLVYSTHIGGNEFDYGYGIAVDGGACVCDGSYPEC
ncbi:MAG: hypothetical protein N2253_06605 [Bacteroidia bacterium]|nr:hypothetical protein [Bacteroidia bacterium]